MHFSITILLALASVTFVRPKLTGVKERKAILLNERKRLTVNNKKKNIVNPSIPQWDKGMLDPRRMLSTVADFFQFTLTITPDEGHNETLCSVADGIFLKNEVDLFLLNFGSKDVNEFASMLTAIVCTEPSFNSSGTFEQGQRRVTSRTTWIWTGSGGCRGCSQEVNDMTAPPQPEDQLVNNTNRFLQNNKFIKFVVMEIKTLIKMIILPNHKQCLGNDPVIDVKASRIGVSGLSKSCQSPESSFLTVSNLNKGTKFRFQSMVCESCISLDFSPMGASAQIVGGTYVNQEWKNSSGVVIAASSAKGGYTPKDQARIYDTSLPVAKGKGDIDLGSPNIKCGGYGVGADGEPGQLGENCVPVKNVLIIQESNTAFTKSNRQGGNITFDFDKPVFLSDVGLIDVDESAQKLVFQYADGRSEVFTFHGLGDNSVQRVIANKFRVKKLVVVLQGTAGVTVLNYCPVCLL